ncbi:MAG: mechanosensitive ion channel family protein [Chitinophagales bacterium]|nr:mechanosensitive ion channel family protein [Chitinophagales bacterium]
MMLLQDFFDNVYLNNTFRQYAWLLGAILFVIIFKTVISKLISKMLFALIRKTKASGKGELFLQLILKPLEYFILLETIFIGINTLHTPNSFKEEWMGTSWQQILYSAYHFLLILNIAWIVSRLADFFISIMRMKAALTEDPGDDQLVSFLKDVLKVLVWTAATFILLGYIFNINVTSLVAGAGIAGIAIAFAAQETLQNIMGSIAIFTEKPFVVGDLVEVNGITGTIVKVGFRSTRVRTMDTSYLTIPNKNIVNNTISNLKIRTSRRLQFIIGLPYETSDDALKKIIADIKKYGDAHKLHNDENVVTLYNFGASALEIWVELFFSYMNWEKWMQLRNDVMFDVMKIVKENGGRFAYPTQIIHVKNDPADKVIKAGN